MFDPNDFWGLVLVAVLGGVGTYIIIKFSSTVFTSNINIFNRFYWGVCGVFVVFLIGLISVGFFHMYLNSVLSENASKEVEEAYKNVYLFFDYVYIFMGFLSPILILRLMFFPVKAESVQK